TVICSHFTLSPSPPPVLPPHSTLPILRSFPLSSSSFFFFNDTPTTEIYTLSLHDALPIFGLAGAQGRGCGRRAVADHSAGKSRRSEEHTSELQSLTNLVCRLLLEKKKKERTRLFPANHSIQN